MLSTVEGGGGIPTRAEAECILRWEDKGGARGELMFEHVAGISKGEEGIKFDTSIKAS